MNFSLSTLNDEDRDKIIEKNREDRGRIIKSTSINDAAKEMALHQASIQTSEFLKAQSEAYSYEGMYKSNGKINGYGSINKQKGVYAPTADILRYSYDGRGIREKHFNLSFRILREVSRKNDDDACFS